jgi:prolyl oligopeptidase
VTGTPRPILDPNRLSPDGSLGVLGWAVSPDGRYLAYTTSVGGSDLKDIRFRSLRTGRDLADTVHRVKFTRLNWTHDSRGLIYNRFRGSRDRANLQDANLCHQSWYHPLGGGAERLVVDRPDDPDDFADSFLSDDGRWLYASSGRGITNVRLWIKELGRPLRPSFDAPFIPIAPEEDASYTPLGVVRNILYLQTNWQAPRGRIVAVDLARPARDQWRTVVPEGEAEGADARRKSPHPPLRLRQVQHHPRRSGVARAGRGLRRRECARGQRVR